jgi:hypothetical protein
MPNVSTTKIALTLCIGLVVGMVLPIVLFWTLWVMDMVIGIFADSKFHADVGLKFSQLYIPFIPIEAISFFFLARFNRTLAAAALPTAILATAYIIHLAAIATPFAPD